MRTIGWILLGTLLLAGCQWDTKAPDETTIGQNDEVPPDAVVRADLSVSTRQFEQDLLARYVTEPIHQGETPWMNEHLHVTKKTIEEKLVDVVVTPYKAAECVVKKVPGQCLQRVWRNCFRRLNPFKCLGGWVNVQVGCLVDVQECAPEIKEVIVSQLTPFEIFKDEIAPTEMRARYEVKLTSADVEALDGVLKVKAGVRLNLAFDIKQGLLGESVTVKGALACSSDFTVSTAAKVIVKSGPEIDLTVTDFGFDTEKVCIPGAVQLADLTLANPTTYVTKELLGPVLKKIVVRALDRQLDQQLSDDLNFREDVAKLADKVRNPIRLGNRELWLRVNPRKVQVSQFSATGSGDSNRLIARIAVVAAPDITFGENPGLSQLPTPLPVEVAEGIQRELFTLIAKGSLSLNSAQKMVMNALTSALNEKQPDAPLIVGHVRIYQNVARFVVAVTFLKRSNRKEVGTVYLAGAPEIDPETRTIRLKNVQFDIDSRRVLLKSADWLLSGVIESAIEHGARLPYGGVLAEIEKAAGERPSDPPDNGTIATEAISIRESGEFRHEAKDIRLVGKLLSVDVLNLWIGNGAIHVSAIAKGRLDMHFRPRP